MAPKGLFVAGSERSFSRATIDRLDQAVNRSLDAISMPEPRRLPLKDFFQGLLRLGDPKTREGVAILLKNLFGLVSAQDEELLARADQICRAWKPSKPFETIVGPILDILRRFSESLRAINQRQLAARRRVAQLVEAPDYVSTGDGDNRLPHNL